MECLPYSFCICPWYKGLILGSVSFQLSLSGLHITWYIIVSLLLCIISFIGFGVFSFSITVLAILKTQGGFSPESALMSRCHRVTEEWNKYIPEIMGLWGENKVGFLRGYGNSLRRQTRETFGSFLEGPVNEKEPWCTDLPAVFEEGAMCLAHYQLAQRRAEHHGKGVQQICCRQNRNRAGQPHARLV